MALVTGDGDGNFLEGTNGNDIIRGFGGRDELRGYAGNDTLEGGDDGDTLEGGDGDDSLDGGPGDDWFRGGAGDDTLISGGGRDRADYQNDTAGIFVDLLSERATDGSGGTDTLIGIWRVIGTGFDDTILGDNGDNSFSGELGDDFIDGREGWDFVWYGRAPSAVRVDLANGNVSGGEGNDTLASIEGLGGSNYSDVLRGNDADNFFTPDFETDSNTPNYTVGGDDTIDGRAGVDAVGYGSAASGVFVDLAAETATDGNGNTDTLISIEQVWGSDFDDTISGTDGDNEIWDQGGDDSLFGLGGNDTFHQGRSGADTYDGGDGFDIIIADLSGAQAGAFTAVVDFAAGTNYAQEFPTNNPDQWTDIEGFVFTGDVDINALMIGDSSNNLIVGEAGDDTISGGIGDDTIAGAGGANELDGGAGIDLLDFSYESGRAFADLGVDQRGAGFLRFYDFGQPQGDVYSNFENILGGDYSDNLRGDGLANMLEGGGVSDRLYGRDGDDTLDGGTGADAIFGGRGADTMTGGRDAERTDRFIYFSESETGVGSGERDIITDFVSGEDRIEISRIDADTTQGFKQRFDFIADAAFSGTAGELRFEQGGGVTLVQADRDGDGAADLEIELSGTIDLTVDDFLI